MGSNTAKTIIGVLVLSAVAVVVGGLVFAQAHTRLPEEDIRATLREIESELHGGATHDAALFQAIYALREAMREAEDALPYGTLWNSEEESTVHGLRIALYVLNPSLISRTDPDVLQAISAFYTSEETRSWSKSLSELVRSPNFVPPTSHDSPERLTDVLKTHLAYARPLGRHEALVFMHRVATADFEGAALHIENALRVARMAHRDPTAVGLLVGVAIESMVYTSVQHAARHPDTPAVLLDELARLLDEHADQQHDRSLTIRGMRLTNIDNLISYYTFEHPDADAMAIYFEFASLRDTSQAWDELERRMIEWERTPRHARSAMTDTPDEYVDALPAEFAALKHMLPAEMRALAFYPTSDAQLGAARLHVAIRQYQERVGNAPDNLEALLAEGLLESLPADPYAPDGMYRYAVDKEAPNGFRLYSVGPDGTDNGGTSPLFSSPNPSIEDRAMNSGPGLDFPYEPPGEVDLTEY